MDTITIDSLGRLFATPEARLAAGVTIARRGKPAGRAPRDMVYEYGGLEWTLQIGKVRPPAKYGNGADHYSNFAMFDILDDDDE